MSRRARLWHVARESKSALAYTGPDDDTDDEGGIDADCLACDGTGLEWDDTTCAACGGRAVPAAPERG